MSLNLNCNTLILGKDADGCSVDVVHINNPTNDPTKGLVKINGDVPYSQGNPPPDHPAHEGGDFSTMYIENPKTTNHDKAIEFTQPNATENLNITAKENGVMTFGFVNDATTMEMFKGGFTVKDGALTCQGGTQIQLAGNTTSTNYSRITQPAGTDGMTLATPQAGNLLIDSGGDVEIVSSNTAPEIKLKINSTNLLSVQPNIVAISAEGTGGINRLCNTTKITEENNVDGRAKEAELKMTSGTSVLEINTAGDGKVQFNTEVENTATHLVNSQPDGSGTNVSASLYADLRLFNAVANMYTTYINVASITPAEQTGRDLSGGQGNKIFIVINTGANTGPFGTAPTMFYPFINNTQLAVDGFNNTGSGVPLFALAEKGISGVEVFCKWFRQNPWPNQQNWNGSGTPPNPPSISTDMLQSDLFPHFTTGGGSGSGTVDTNVIDNWSFSFNFAIPNNNGNASNQVLFNSTESLPVSHSYESKAKFNTGGGANSAFVGSMPTINYFTDTNTNITGINYQIPIANFTGDDSLLDNMFLLTQVRVLSKYVGTPL